LLGPISKRMLGLHVIVRYAWMMIGVV